MKRKLNSRFGKNNNLNKLSNNRQKGVSNNDSKYNQNLNRIKKSDLSAIQSNLKELPKIKKSINSTNYGMFANGMTSNTVTINMIQNNHKFNNNLSQILSSESEKNQNIQYQPFKAEDRLNSYQNYVQVSDKTVGNSFENQMNRNQNAIDAEDNNFVSNIFNGIEKHQNESQSTFSDYGFRIFDEPKHNWSQTLSSDELLERNSVITNDSFISSEQTLASVQIYANNRSQNTINELSEEYPTNDLSTIENVMNNYSNERKEFAKRIPEFNSDILWIICHKLRSIAISNSSPLNKEWIENIIKLRRDNH